MNLLLTAVFENGFQEIYLPAVDNRTAPAEIRPHISGWRGDITLPLEVWDGVWSLRGSKQFALMAGLPEEQMGLGHAFEMDPEMENGFLYEMAQAQMAREIFPKAPLKYMPPTKYMTGDIFKGHIQDALFNIITVTTHQKLCLLGMLTEAIHTPLMQDRALSIANAKYIFNNLKDFGDEIEFKQGGIMQTRVEDVLLKAYELVRVIETEGLFESLQKGTFGGVKRPLEGGKGLSGVVQKS